LLTLNHIFYASPDKGVDCDECKELLSNSPDLGTAGSISFCANLHINDSYIVSIVNCDPGIFEFTTRQDCENWFKASNLNCKCDRLCYVSVGTEEEYIDNIGCDENSAPC